MRKNYFFRRAVDVGGTFSAARVAVGSGGNKVYVAPPYCTVQYSASRKNKNCLGPLHNVFRLFWICTPTKGVEGISTQR